MNEKVRNLLNTYQGISLPKPLLDEIRVHIETRKYYTTITSFIKHAILAQLDKEKNLENNPPHNLIDFLNKLDYQIDEYRKHSEQLWEQQK